ncbi:MAG: glycogen/starch/alpha-glucan phosphorylase [Eubacteriales bacterium]|nr:glycogen/starch/alpha-glucan phosphorylase [Eubacteriales bacterium]
MEKKTIMEALERRVMSDYQVSLTEATTAQLHNALGSVVMSHIADQWYSSRHEHERTRRAYYFSAEYLMGRMVHNNLYALNLLEEVKAAFAADGLDFNCMEDIEDAALGNGGLGRLAACFLDSAATHDLPLDGYGIRYKFGLFHQSFRHGYQVETADDWQKQGDPWSVRRETHITKVTFKDRTVLAVPYDMPIIGYETDNIGTLRLWQSEPVEEFDFAAFNAQQYAQAVSEKNAVEDISRVLYPNDSTIAGKKLRLMQQYFLSSASLQDVLFNYKRVHGSDLSSFAENVTIQLNDTHPTVSIPELVRLLMLEGFSFDDAFDTASQVFNYTNHTVMAEALEKWDVELFRSVIPDVFDVVYKINARFCGELMKRNFPDIASVSIIQGNYIHMANLAVYGCRYTNGVAELHTQILKNDLFSEFYGLYPDRFQNKTNGITQRRWLGVCNPRLSAFITERIGSGWVTDLAQLERLKAFQSPADIAAFNKVKQTNKETLCRYIKKMDGVDIPSTFIMDVQVKRLHEYKRQLLNALAILDIYYSIKDGTLKDFPPTVFLFGAKAAPGYQRAKAVIKFINDIAVLINNDPDVKDLMRVIFVQNYNCSYAEHIIPAADISEQISPAGTEASGTGNMKLMLNCAVTLGTYDGANIEIFQQAGLENNFKFGRSVEELNELRATYDAKALYVKEPRIRRVVDTLINGAIPVSDAARELYDSLLVGASWHKADHYFVLLELLPYIERKLEAIRAYQDRDSFGRMCLMNVASAGKFSSDRTIEQYARDIWRINSL